MTFYHPDMGSASDWLYQIFLAAQPIRSTTQIWVVTCHQYEISALIPKMQMMSFCGEFFRTSGGVVKCWLFSWAVQTYDNNTISLSLENLLHNHSLLLEVVGTRKNARTRGLAVCTRGRQAPSSLACPFFLAPTTSKCLLCRIA